MKFSPGIIDNLKNADQALADAEAELTKIQEKKRATEAKLPALQEALEKAGAKKQTAFDAFLVDELSEDTIDHTQRALDEAKRAAERTEEVLNALAGKENELETRTHKLREKQSHAQRIIWNELADRITAQLSRELSAKIHYAYALNFRKLSSAPWEPFLLSLFQRPDREDLTAYDQRLNELFKAETSGD